MSYIGRAWNFASENSETLTRLYLGGVIVPAGIYWDGYFVAETIRAGQDLLYSQTTQEVLHYGSEVLMGGTMGGLMGLCVILSAIAAIRGSAKDETNSLLEEQLQPQES